MADSELVWKIWRWWRKIWLRQHSKPSAPSLKEWCCSTCSSIFPLENPSREPSTKRPLTYARETMQSGIDLRNWYKRKIFRNWYKRKIFSKLLKILSLRRDSSEGNWGLLDLTLSILGGINYSSLPSEVCLRQTRDVILNPACRLFFVLIKVVAFLQVYSMFNDELNSVKKELSAKITNVLPHQPKYAGAAHWARALRRRIDRPMAVSGWMFIRSLWVVLFFVFGKNFFTNIFLVTMFWIASFGDLTHFEGFIYFCWF